MSCGISPLFGLVHSAWQSLGSSMLFQMALFHSFQWLSNIPLYFLNQGSVNHGLWATSGPLTYFFSWSLFIYLLLAAPGLSCSTRALCCCVWAFSSCSEQGVLFTVVRLWTDGVNEWTRQREKAFVFPPLFTQYLVCSRFCLGTELHASWDKMKPLFLFPHISSRWWQQGSDGWREG